MRMRFPGEGEPRGHCACDRREKINGPRSGVKKNVIGSVKIILVDRLVLPKWNEKRFNSIKSDGGGL
jgi:hypothetical protein